MRAVSLPKGRLAENVMHFVGVLRAAGLPVGPGQGDRRAGSGRGGGLANRTDFREALAAVLVSRHEHLELFEQAFDLFWRNPKLLETADGGVAAARVRRTGEERRRTCRRAWPQAMLRQGA